MLKFVLNLILNSVKPSVVIKGYSYPRTENGITKAITKIDSFDVVDSSLEVDDEEKQIVSNRLLEILNSEFQELIALNNLNNLPKDKVIRKICKENIILNNPYSNPKILNCYIKPENNTMSIKIADKKWIFEPQS